MKQFALTAFGFSLLASVALAQMPGGKPPPDPCAALAKFLNKDAKFTASAAFKTKLLIGSSAAFTVELDGKPIGSGKGTGKAIQPDTEGYDVVISAGEHTLKIVVVGTTEAVLYSRFLDPERKLTYPEAK